MAQNKIPQFVELAYEDYPNIHIVAYSLDGTAILAHDKKTMKAYYIYEVSREDNLSMCFHLLCEVGETYKAWFDETIALLKIKTEIVNTQNDYYEKLIKYRVTDEG